VNVASTLAKGFRWHCRGRRTGAATSWVMEAEKKQHCGTSNTRTRLCDSVVRVTLKSYGKGDNLTLATQKSLNR